ncbi:MAG: hypothetical protein P4L40_07490 [Terracidiphilus sp.]|nr:hypothetical protein [Terracidiphilus sp.]
MCCECVCVCVCVHERARGLACVRACVCLCVPAAVLLPFSCVTGPATGAAADV